MTYENELKAQENVEKYRKIPFYITDTNIKKKLSLWKGKFKMLI